MTTPRTPTRIGLSTVAILVAVLSAPGCSSTYGTTAHRSTTSTGATASLTPAPPHPAAHKHRPARAAKAGKAGPGSAAALVARLRVRGRGPMTGYSRERFGQAWLDADRNGCDTRDDMLRRTLHALTLRSGTNGCVVTSGILDDPYTGARIRYVRDQSYSVDIDHVVALGNAWVSGAARWDIRQRAALANDPLNLLAVDASANRSKGDGDAATWLPPNKRYRCAYVSRQATVKTKYGLSVTPAERAAMLGVLTACPGQPVTPDPTHAPTSVDQHIHDPAAPATGTSTSSGSVYYANCAAVRAAGKAPLHRGDPGYETPRLDRDGDGTACE